MGEVGAPRPWPSLVLDLARKAYCWPLVIGKDKIATQLCISRFFSKDSIVRIVSASIRAVYSTDFTPLSLTL